MPRSGALRCALRRLQSRDIVSLLALGISRVGPLSRSFRLNALECSIQQSVDIVGRLTLDRV